MPPLPTPLDAETTLDISHESLIRQWKTLNTWVVAEAEAARQYQRLEDAAKRRQQRRGAELWRGVDLENARIWKERKNLPNPGRHATATLINWQWIFFRRVKLRRKNSGARMSEPSSMNWSRPESVLNFSELGQKSRRVRAAEQARAASRFKLITVAISAFCWSLSPLPFSRSFSKTGPPRHNRMRKKRSCVRNEKEKEAVDAAEEAKRQQEIAGQQRQVAVVRLARYFSAASGASIKTQPSAQHPLSIEALKAVLIPAAEEALRNALTNIFANTVLVGHEGAVWGVAFSPDGQVLATTSDDRTVRLWSLSNPTAEPRVLRGHRESGVGRGVQSRWPGAGDDER